MNISGEEVARAIKSFLNGSIGGPDGLRPQHLKDMTGSGSGEGGHQLLKVLPMSINIILRGDTPDFIIPFFFDASLEVEGAIRPLCGLYPPPQTNR